MKAFENFRTYLFFLLIVLFASNKITDYELMHIEVQLKEVKLIKIA